MQEFIEDCLTLENFNSIKVRLELSSRIDNIATELFQFHKGAIRTYKDVEVYKGLYLFQFHKGAIRTR